MGAQWLRKTRPFITERLLMVRKESNLINKNKQIPNDISFYSLFSCKTLMVSELCDFPGSPQFGHFFIKILMGRGPKDIKG